MKNNISLLFSLIMLAALGFSSCTNSSAVDPATIDGSVIKGTVTNAANTQVYFDLIQLSNNGTQVIAKADVDANNNFQIDLADGIERGVYRIRIGARKAIIPFNGDEKLVEINTDLANLSKYQFEIKGSEGAAGFLNIMQGIMNRTANPTAVLEYVKNAKNPVAAALIALRGLPFGESNIPQHNAIAARLDKEMPNSSYARDYKAMIGQVQRQIASQQAQQKIKVGEPAPDIKLPNPNGKEYALSDLKGKVVLLDFWASWCGPCRRANPHVVETYKKYKNKGFTVFSVSLDGLDSRARSATKSAEMLAQRQEASKKRWVDAIAKDKLKSNYHVSDLRKWESAPAATYGVRGIPRTFLIDKEGKIAVVNPNHMQLEAELKKLL